MTAPYQMPAEPPDARSCLSQTSAPHAAEASPLVDVSAGNYDVTAAPEEAASRAFLNFQSRPPINYVGRDVRPSALYESDTSRSIRVELEAVEARLEKIARALSRAERPRLRVVR